MTKKAKLRTRVQISMKRTQRCAAEVPNNRALTVCQADENNEGEDEEGEEEAEDDEDEEEKGSDEDGGKDGNDGEGEEQAEPEVPVDPLLDPGLFRMGQLQGIDESMAKAAYAMMTASVIAVKRAKEIEEQRRQLPIMNVRIHCKIVNFIVNLCCSVRSNSAFAIGGRRHPRGGEGPRRDSAVRRDGQRKNDASAAVFIRGRLHKAGHDRRNGAKACRRCVCLRESGY